MTTAAALAFHALTSYPRNARVGPTAGLPPPRADFISCRPAGLLPEVKQYEAGLGRLALPTRIPRLGVSATAALAAEQGPDLGRLDLADLARLLFYSAGVVRYRDSRQRGRIHFRACGSAGALHPLELYVVTGDRPGLPSGVWHFDPIAYDLSRVAAAHRDTPPYLIITGVPARTGWKYAERGYRHVWWDCGTLLAQLLVVARSAGLPARIQLAFPDAQARAVVGADGVHELPLAVIPLTSSDPQLIPAGQPAVGQLGVGPVEFPLVTATHRAGEPVSQQWGFSPAREPPLAVPREASHEPLEALILRRGSTRRFDPAGGVSTEALTWGLSVASRPPPWDAGPSLLEHHVFAHHVTGLRPGRYRWAAGQLARAARHPGSSRTTAWQLCAGLDLARDAACVTVHCADLKAVTSHLGERGYRAASLEAGYAHGRLLLASFALGHGASALTVADGQAPAVLDTRGDPLLATAAGIPAYTSRPGGPPTAPARLTRPSVTAAAPSPGHPAVS